MKKLAYLLLIATTSALIACSQNDPYDDFYDYSYTPDGSSATSSATTSSSSSSSSTSDYVNTDPTSIDFSNDFISSNFTASNTTVITFSSSGATVENAVSGDTIDVSGGYVTAKLHSTGTILKLTGSTSEGGLYVESDKKFEICLSSVTMTNPSGTAINIQDGHCFVVVEGSNSLSDSSGSGYSSSTDAKSVFHSEDKLRFSGSGSLTLTANNAAEKHALSSDDWIVVDGPAITATSGSNAGQAIKVNDGFFLNSGTVTASASGAAKKAINSEAFVYVKGGTLKASAAGSYAYDSDDQEYKSAVAIKADGYVTIAGGDVTATCTGAGGKGVSSDYIINMLGGTLNATATGSDTNSTIDKAPKAIKADGGMLVEGGTINASSSNHEAIESKSILKVTGGVVYAKAKDDAINSANDMVLSGGYVCGYSTGNDAIDANGNLYVQGSVVYAISTAGGAETAVDANTEGGYRLYVQSGSLVAYPSLENGSSISQTCYKVSVSSTNSWNALYSGDNVAFVFKAPKTGSYIVSSSSPSVKTGVSVSDGTSIFDGYGYQDATVTGGTSASLSSYSSGNSGVGGGGRGW